MQSARSDEEFVLCTVECDAIGMGQTDAVPCAQAADEVFARGISFDDFVGGIGPKDLLALIHSSPDLRRLHLLTSLPWVLQSSSIAGTEWDGNRID